MIPVSLYGVDVNRCESFYDKLPGLVADSIDDEEYSDALFAIQNKASMERLFHETLGANPRHLGAPYSPKAARRAPLSRRLRRQRQ